MNEIIPSILRAIVSTTANVLLMMIFLQPKYSKKATFITMASILIADLGTAIYCYVSGNLTLLSKLDVILFTVLCFAARPMFKDNFMQWLFSYLTVQNISDAVIIVSFMLSRYFPYPIYTNTLFRLILFGIIITIFALHIRPIYWKVLEHWNEYFAVAFFIYISFSYYVLSSDDIIKTFIEQRIPLLLIVLIGVASYSSIFLSLKNLQRQFEIDQENQKIQSEKEYMQLAANNMSQRLELMNKVSSQNMIYSHDRRHFNNVILELLEQEKVSEAINLLKNQNQVEPKIGKTYCENVAVNAAVCHYNNIAQQTGIITEISIDIPEKLPIDSLELSMVISNLMENAINACGSLTENQTPHIRFICKNIGRLIMEIENTCPNNVDFDENGHPITTKKGHGIGIKSIISFVKKYDCEILYTVENNIFKVRLLI